MTPANNFYNIEIYYCNSSYVSIKHRRYPFDKKFGAQETYCKSTLKKTSNKC